MTAPVPSRSRLLVSTSCMPPSSPLACAEGLILFEHSVALGPPRDVFDTVLSFDKKPYNTTDVTCSSEGKWDDARKVS